MTEKMSPEQARHFEHGYSLNHETILALTAAEKGCTCQAYVDWFTYDRWQAQGFQVQKAQHGVKLTQFVERTKIDKATGETITYKMPWRTTVFCRCQVKAKE